MAIPSCGSIRNPAHRYHAVPSPGFESTTLWLRIRHPNHSVTTFSYILLRHYRVLYNWRSLASCVNGCKTKETTWPAVLEMTSIFRVFSARNLNCVLWASDFQWRIIGSIRIEFINFLLMKTTDQANMTSMEERGGHIEFLERCIMLAHPTLITGPSFSNMHGLHTNARCWPYTLCEKLLWVFYIENLYWF
jgi:hypothetical protein